jgi:diacylglycerol kinase (ATP)
MNDPVFPVDTALPASHRTFWPAPLLDARWLVIRNPAAGRSRRHRAWLAFERALRRAGVQFDVHSTHGPGDGARLAQAAMAEGLHRVLVAGGDGSVHEALNGLMRARDTHGASAPVPTLVPVPLGTGNDWARTLGLPRDPDRLAALVAHGAPRPHDAGVISFASRGGDRCWFVNVAGAGFDAHVLARLPVPTPSRLAYLAGALRELRRYQSPRFRIATDDAPAREGRLLLALVANGQYCGHRMHVAPCAVVDDGRFDVVTIDEVGLLRALPRLAALYAGTVLRDPLVRHATAARVRIDSDPSVAVEADGQLVGTTPAEFTIMRGALLALRGD